MNVGDSVTLDKTIAVGAGRQYERRYRENRQSSTERNRVKETSASSIRAIPECRHLSIAVRKRLRICRIPSTRLKSRRVTTPDNAPRAQGVEESERAHTQDEWETWHCTAYPSSIAYQIEEVLPGAVASRCARWPRCRAMC